MCGLEMALPDHPCDFALLPSQAPSYRLPMPSEAAKISLVVVASLEKSRKLVLRVVSDDWMSSLRA